MKRKVEMLPGAPNRRQTLHIREEEQGGMRVGKEGGKEEHSSMNQRSKGGGDYTKACVYIHKA